MVRILLERTNGHAGVPGEKVGDYAHKFVDITNRPSMTITNRVLTLAIEPGGAPIAPDKTDKPPYRVPSMAEINAVEPNGFKVCSLFAGTGGSSLGYRMAGFRMLYANEFVEAARDSYAANAREGTIIDGRDIRTVDPVEILLRTGLKVGELDVLDGSPPCSSFSEAGLRQKGWARVKAYSETEQRTDDLFYEYIRILEGLRPKVFVAENVSGLVKGVSKGHFLNILEKMKALGYRVRAATCDAQWLGVPQRRKRVFFVGVRDDLNRDPVFPKPLRYRYTLRDALPWIDRAVHDTSGQFSTGDFTNKPAPPILVGPNALNSRHYKIYGPEPQPEDADASIERYEIGKEWAKLPPGGQSERYYSLIRADPAEPSPTITAGSGVTSLAGVTHPFECRKFTIAELRRVCSFPDDFVLTGTYQQQWERLGRAVPPVMMSHVATAIRDGILRP